MFLFVEARIARTARCPFLAIYIKYRFFRQPGKISTSHEHPCTNLCPSPPSWSLFNRYPSFVKPALLGLTNGTTKEKSLFSRVCPISRLHPSSSPRSVPFPPLLRPQLDRRSALLSLQLLLSKLARFLPFLVSSVSAFAPLFLRSISQFRLVWTFLGETSRLILFCCYITLPYSPFHFSLDREICTRAKLDLLNSNCRLSNRWI